MFHLTVHHPQSRASQLIHGLAEVSSFVKASGLAVLEIRLGGWPEAVDARRGEASAPEQDLSPSTQAAPSSEE